MARNIQEWASLRGGSQGHDDYPLPASDKK